MRVGVTELHHFVVDGDGHVHTDSGCDYAFYQRYLRVFDEVVVLARVRDGNGVTDAIPPNRSSGPGVRFLSLPEFRGAGGYLRCYGLVGERASELTRSVDAIVLRIPSYMATRVWRKLRVEGRPYAAEVVGDPWMALSPGASKSPLRPLLRAKWTRDLERQCREAAMASYVTESALQRRYPTPAWSTHYSSIELASDTFADDARIEARTDAIDRVAAAGGRWRLVLVGTLVDLRKSPDIAIDAVAELLSRGVDAELTIVGGGQHQPELEQRASDAALGERVRFVGHVPAGEPVQEQLDRAHVFVLPSRSEGLPRAVIEAMARGLPCIGTRAGGIPELLGDDFLIAPGNAGALAEAIDQLVTDPERMKAAVRRNIDKAAEYRSDVLMARRDELYRRLEDATRNWLERKPHPHR